MFVVVLQFLSCLDKYISLQSLPVRIFLATDNLNTRKQMKVLLFLSIFLFLLTLVFLFVLLFCC